MAKYFKAIDVDVVGDPDGDGRRVIALLVSNKGDVATGDTILAEDVQGLSETDIIDAGSVLICPAGTFIFFIPNEVTKKDDASGASVYDYAPAELNTDPIPSIDPGSGAEEA